MSPAKRNPSRLFGESPCFLNFSPDGVFVGRVVKERVGKWIRTIRGPSRDTLCLFFCSCLFFLFVFSTATLDEFKRP